MAEPPRPGAAAGGAGSDRPAAGRGGAADPRAAVRTRGYLAVLAVAALIGAPVSAVAFGFLALAADLQRRLYHDLPSALGFAAAPPWWPVPLLLLAGVLVALTIRYLPGTGGHEPSAGFSTEGASATTPAELPGVVLAALATLSLGAVLGPEAPLITLGGGLAAGAVRLLGRARGGGRGGGATGGRAADGATGGRMAEVVGAAGAFAAVSALLGSPLLGAFLLMEASGLGGPLLGVVLVPGLLASGIGSLVFTGLGSWTGLGTESLTLHHVPPVPPPDLPQFGWAVLIGLLAGPAGAGIRRLAVLLARRVAAHRLPATAAAGLAVAGLAVGYAQGTGHPVSQVLFSGQEALSPLLEDGAGYPAAVLLLLLVCKALAYALSLSAFRGGPIFPAMYLGAVGGTLLSHAGGLPPTAGFAMGIGAMGVAVLGLPLTSVLLATLLLGRPGLTVLPLVIVAVVVSYVTSLVTSP